MAGSSTTTDSDGFSSFLTFNGSNFKWNGSFKQLKSFFEKPPLSWKGEWDSRANEHRFKLDTPSSTITFFKRTKTLQIQGKKDHKECIEDLFKKQINQSSSEQCFSVPNSKRKACDSGESSASRKRTRNDIECDGKCNEIYPDVHIKQRVGDHKILGFRHQFCAAFYHVHKKYYPDERQFGNYDCLDKEKCIIGKEAKESIGKAKGIAKKAEEFATEAEQFARETRKKNQKSSENTEKAARNAKTFATNTRNLAKGWKVQPRTVVAVAKFEKEDSSILYQARYTNCVPQMKHAEDFFKEDVENGELATKIEKNLEGGTITIYLTLQPCNKSTTRGTKGTPPDQSCCKTLKDIFTNKLKGRKIKLCVKPTNLCRLEVKNKDVNDNADERKHKDDKDYKGNTVDEDEHLRRNAVRGIKMLMRHGVQVIEMTTEDWKYLFGMTEEVRDQRDREIQEILNQIEDQIHDAQNSLDSPI